MDETIEQYKADSNFEPHFDSRISIGFLQGGVIRNQRSLEALKIHD